MVFFCELCPDDKKFAFKTEKTLKGHVDRIHLKKGKIFECDQCEKKFQFKSHLENHKAVHANLKSFKCDVEGCGWEGGNTKEELKRHKSAKHSGKKFDCEACGVYFKQDWKRETIPVAAAIGDDGTENKMMLEMLDTEEIGCFHHTLDNYLLYASPSDSAVPRIIGFIEGNANSVLANPVDGDEEK